MSTQDRKLSRVELHGDAETGNLDDTVDQKALGDEKDTKEITGESAFKHIEGEGADAPALAVDEFLSDDEDDCIDETTAFHGELSPAIYMQPHIKVAKEVSEKFPLIGHSEPLDRMQQEYGKGRGYPSRFADLKRKYRRLRRIRNDGDSLYRAFAFATFEFMIQNRAMNDRLQDYVKEAKHRLIECGLDDFAVDELTETVRELMEQINSGMSEFELYEVMNDQAVSDSVVAFLRLVNSANMRIENEYYCHIPKEQNMTMDEFCKKRVEPLSAPQEDIHIASLSNATGVGVRVEDLEPVRLVKNVAIEEGAKEIVIEYFPPTGRDYPFYGVLPRVFLLRRPNHFDVLYR